MRNRSWIVVGALVAGTCVAVQLSARSWGQQAGTPDSSPPAVSDEEQQLNLRYAQAYLNLMEVTLRRYDESNRRSPGTVRPTVIQGLQEAVRKARERVDSTKANDVIHSQEYILAAQAQLGLAEESLRKAEAANARRSGSVNATEVARLAAQRDLAVVRLEKARHLATESPLSNVRYELDQLREEVGELKLFVSLLRVQN